MLVLSATNTMSADTTASSVLTYTIFGMELNAGVEVYKVLAQGYVASTIGTIYTVPSSTTAFIKTMSFVNNDTVVRTLELTVNGTATSNRITPILEIPAGGMAVYEDGIGWRVYTSNGIMLQGANPLSLVESAMFLSGCKAESYPRQFVEEVNTALLATGRLSLQAIAIRAGELLTSISFWSATTALGTGTNQLFGLYDSALNLLRSSVNDGATAWGANTRKTLNLTSSFTTTYSGLYYLAIMVTATTVPTLKGRTAKTGGQLGASAPVLHGTSNTGLTTALPNPANAITSVLTPVWGCVN